VVEKEVRKKMQIYGTVAILSAVVLGALIYGFSAVPVVFNPNVTPMKTFSSYEELNNFLAVNALKGYYGYVGGPLDAKFFAERAPGVVLPAVPVPEQASSSGQPNPYSTTNIQVAGVDEADTVKNDGKYIYTISTVSDFSIPRIVDNTVLPTIWNVIYIVKADPQDPKVIAKITLDNDTYPAGIFLSEDSSRLAVLASQYQVTTHGTIRQDNDVIFFSYQRDVNTVIYVYDISDKAYPVLARNFTISGSYFNSRMIGNNVYTVVSQPAYAFDNNGTITNVTLPKVYDASKVAKVSEVAPQNVYYADTIPSYFTFTTFIGLNILDEAQEPTHLTLLMGGTSVMYVSMNNIYITYPTGSGTSIYRVRVNGSALAFEAKGSVAGYVLNQYSMDEDNGYFRVATTWNNNNVYVLNMNLSLVGRLENLAEGERIYSVRFMGNKGYVVTFRQTDPFFVIDLNNPTDPKVAGELKIPGYSSYLHPYDENHIIGLGKENNTVKLSLFDVTNVKAPIETAKYVVNGDWSDSQALQDPKAFLFDKQKELLVIPMSVTTYTYINRTAEELARGEETMQTSEWQGAYVFKLTLTSGFTLRGGIAHYENATIFHSEYYEVVNRALYIGNTLYTISNGTPPPSLSCRVKLTSLTDLTPIAEVMLS
jgi:inhibitor of cysteine peptidase